MKYFFRILKVLAFEAFFLMYSFSVFAGNRPDVLAANPALIEKNNQSADSVINYKTSNICMAVLLKFSNSDEIKFEKWLAIMLSQISVPIQIKLGDSAIQNCMIEKPQTLIILAHTIPFNRSENQINTSDNLNFEDKTFENQTLKSVTPSKRILVNEVRPGEFEYIYNINLLSQVSHSGLKHLYFQACSWQYLFSPAQLKKYSDQGIQITGAKPTSENNFDQLLTNFITDIPDFINQIYSN